MLYDYCAKNEFNLTFYAPNIANGMFQIILFGNLQFEYSNPDVDICSLGASELGGQGGQLPTHFLAESILSFSLCPPTFWPKPYYAHPLFISFRSPCGALIHSHQKVPVRSRFFYSNFGTFGQFSQKVLKIQKYHIPLWKALISSFQNLYRHGPWPSPKNCQAPFNETRTFFI